MGNRKSQYQLDREEFAEANLCGNEYFIPHSGVIVNIGSIPSHCLKYYKKAPSRKDVEKLSKCMCKSLPIEVVYNDDDGSPMYNKYT